MSIETNGSINSGHNGYHGENDVPPFSNSLKANPVVFVPGKQTYFCQKTFLGLIGSVQVTGIIALGLLIAWFSKFGPGMAWSPDKRFSYHPVFMYLGLVYFGGNSMLVYRALRYQKKPFLKLLHAGFNLGSFVFALIGIIAVASLRFMYKAPHLWSLHSWLGLIAVVLFFLQLVAGFVTFLLPATPGHIRASLLPVHVYLGQGIFWVSVVTTISGITEHAYTNAVATKIQMPPVSLVANFLAVFVAIFALLVGYVLHRAEYKRQPLPEEMPIQTNAN